MRMLMVLVSLMAAASVLASGNADDGRSITKSPLDHVTLYADSISKDTPIRIRRFGTENAHLGTGAKENKPKYQQIAKDMKEQAPEMIVQGVIEKLRTLGFEDVAEAQPDDPMPDRYLLVEGEFTELNPGSRGKRYWAGYGAGKSKVCAEGRVVDEQDSVLMEFQHCRHQALGVFGGDSKGQMKKDSYASGSHFAEFFDKWARGKYASDTNRTGTGT